MQGWHIILRLHSCLHGNTRIVSTLPSSLSNFVGIFFAVIRSDGELVAVRADRCERPACINGAHLFPGMYVVHRRSPDPIAIRAVCLWNFFMLKMKKKKKGQPGIYFPSPLQTVEFVIAENLPNNARHQPLSSRSGTNNSKSIIKAKIRNLIIRHRSAQGLR